MGTIKHNFKNAIARYLVIVNIGAGPITYSLRLTEVLDPYRIAVNQICASSTPDLVCGSSPDLICGSTPDFICGSIGKQRLTPAIDPKQKNTETIR